MKKVVVVICLLMTVMGAHAQFEKGKWVVNPSLTGLNLSHSEQTKTEFGIAAQAGTFLVDNVALLVTLEGDWAKGKDVYAAGVGGRYYFDQLGVYLGSGFKMKRENLNGIDKNDVILSLEAGYAYFLSRTVTIEPSLYYDLSFKDSNCSRLGLKVGFGFYF